MAVATLILWTQILQAAATNILAIQVAHDITTSVRTSSPCLRTPSAAPSDATVPVRVARLNAAQWLCANQAAHAEVTLSGLALGADPVSLLERGLAGLELGHVDTALSDLAAAGAAPYFLNRALALEAQGSLPGAIQQTGLALQIDPSYIPALIATGRMYASEDRWDDALQRLETASKVPDAGLRATFWRDLGYATYRATGNRGAATEDFQRAIDQDPGDPQTFLLFADMAIRSGDYDSVGGALQRTTALAPDDDVTLVKAAKLYLTAAEPSLAQHLLEARITRANGKVLGEVYFYDGLALEQLHDERAALAVYVAASDRYPLDPRWSREVSRVQSISSK